MRAHRSDPKPWVIDNRNDEHTTMISRTTRLALLTAGLLSFAVVNAGRAEAQEPGDLSVTFSGLTAPTGALYVGVYDSEAAFGGGKPVAGERVAVNGATASLTLSGLKPGRYAIKVFHDIDGDGRMNTNPYGIPLEPYAASNNAPANMGPPRWSDAVFDVTAEGAVQDITIQ